MTWHVLKFLEFQESKQPKSYTFSNIWQEEDGRKS